MMPESLRNGETYVHGYDVRESERLRDQASTLTAILHGDTSYPEGESVLEAGCGVGAQTLTLARNSPGAHITSIDTSNTSLAQAREAVQAAGIGNVTFRRADIFDLPFPDASFDHVFVCFVLEHLTQPQEALRALQRVLKRGGSFTVIEGDHGSAYFHPESKAARCAIDCLIDLQRRAGGNGLIGRALYPLLVEARLDDVRVSARTVYVDGSRPGLAEMFTKRTFTAMIESVREAAIESRLIAASDFDRGIADLYRAAEPDGVFCYTFFKGAGFRS